MHRSWCHTGIPSSAKTSSSPTRTLESHWRSCNTALTTSLLHLLPSASRETTSFWYFPSPWDCLLDTIIPIRLVGDYWYRDLSAYRYRFHCLPPSRTSTRHQGAAPRQLPQISLHMRRKQGCAHAVTVFSVDRAWTPISRDIARTIIDWIQGKSFGDF